MAIKISDRNDFSYFCSSSQLAFWLRRRREKQIFQDCSHGGHHGFWIGTILAIFYLQSLTLILLPSFKSICLSVQENHNHIIIGFLINMQVQGQHPHQWAPFQIAGLLHAWQISHQISRYVYHKG